MQVCFQDISSLHCQIHILLLPSPNSSAAIASTTFRALTTHPSSNGMPGYAYEPQTQIPGPSTAFIFPAPCNGPKPLRACTAHCHHFRLVSLHSPGSAVFAACVSTARSRRATDRMLSGRGARMGFVVWYTAGKWDGHSGGGYCTCVAMVYEGGTQFSSIGSAVGLGLVWVVSRQIRLRSRLSFGASGIRVPSVWLMTIVGRY